MYCDESCYSETRKKYSGLNEKSLLQQSEKVSIRQKRTSVTLYDFLMQKKASSKRASNSNSISVLGRSKFKCFFFVFQNRASLKTDCIRPACNSQDLGFTVLTTCTRLLRVKIDIALNH